ncbi:hypothetical protein SSX86_026600 [Deinandra increscens subsp. villosa]|uniref:Uncharacterized protein n=1 Tax=Deinandra increscens subsp. villosa TaxID=3103831 RepID=A0AAP0CJW6_9ASTR
MSVFLSSSPILSSTTPTLILNLHNHNASQSHTSIRLLNSTGKLHFFVPSSICSILITGLNDKHLKNKYPYAALSVNASLSTTQTINDSSHGKSSRKRYKKQQPLLSEGRDNDEDLGLVCPGCGVFMQDEDSTLPGYYQKKKAEVTDAFEDEFVSDAIEGELEDTDGEESEFESEIDDISDDELEIEDEFDWESDFEDDEDDLKELDGFTAPGVGYGNITEEVIEKGKKKRVSKSERKKLARESQLEKEEVTVCARCHSLRNYGQVKNQTAENLIPDFDFDKLISTRLMKPTGNSDSTVVIMVVDCVDFDGSFPKRAAKSLFESLEGGRDGLQRSKKLPKLVLVATKVDLLPSQISPTRLDRWVRHRAKAHGAPRLNGVYLVSSRKDLGVRNLLTFVKDLAGPRGHVWVIGAQNAGKSTLINALAKKGGVRKSQ